MGGKKSPVDIAGDIVRQTAYDIGGAAHISGVAALTGEEPRKREKKKAVRKAAQEKAAARARIKPMPDPELAKTASRRAAAMKRRARGGRASTILSEGTDTLGG